MRLPERSSILLLALIGGTVAWKTRVPSTSLEYDIEIGADHAKCSVRIEQWHSGASFRLAACESEIGIPSWRLSSSEGSVISDRVFGEGVGREFQPQIWHQPSRSGELRIDFAVCPPPIPEGDGGYRRRFGTVDRNYAALTLGHFLLLPRGFDWDHAAIRIQIPEGWKRLGPPIPSIIEGAQLNSLIDSPIVAGPFETLSVPATAWNLTLHEDYPDPVRKQFQTEMAILAVELSPSIPGIENVSMEIALAPRLSDQVSVGSIETEHFVFLDADLPTPRLRGEIARHLVRSFASRRPSPQQNDWFSVAAAEWAADRMTKESPGVTETHLRTYEENLPRSDIAIEFEPSFPFHGDLWTRERRVKAASVLWVLDSALRDRGCSEGAASLVRTWARGSSGSETVSRLLGRAAADRCRTYLREGRFPLRRTPPIEFSDAPPSALPVPGRELPILFTGRGAGFLETCGCSSAAAGGLARRGRIVSDLRDRGYDPLVLDLGDFLTFLPPAKLDPVRRDEQRLYADILALLKTDAVAIGQGELLRGSSALREMLDGCPLPLVSANARGPAGPLAPPFKIVERSGLRIGILGYSEPWIEEAEYRSFAESLSESTLEENPALLEPSLDRLRAEADLTILIGRIGPRSLRTALDRYGDRIDAILTSDPLARTGAPLARRSTFGGFAGRTLVLFHVLAEQGVSGATLTVARHRILAFRGALTKLDDPVSPDTAVRERLDAFYRSLAGRSTETGALLPPMFRNDPDIRDTFVDESSCANCHPLESAQWKSTKHARAFSTLVKAQRQYHPDCVRCHVTGFGWESGYRMETPDPLRRNVNCQVCHGPAREHLARPARGTLRRTPLRETCMECHDPKHSPAFENEFADYWNRVVHR